MITAEINNIPALKEHDIHVNKLDQFKFFFVTENRSREQCSARSQMSNGQFTHADYMLVVYKRNLGSVLRICGLNRLDGDHCDTRADEFYPIYAPAMK